MNDKNPNDHSGDAFGYTHPQNDPCGIWSTSHCGPSPLKFTIESLLATKAIMDDMLNDICVKLGVPPRIFQGREVPTEKSPEELVDMARFIKHCSPRLLLADRPMTDAELATVKLALDLAKRPGVALRAMLEGWDRKRVVREIY